MGLGGGAWSEAGEGRNMGCSGLNDKSVLVAGVRQTSQFPRKITTVLIENGLC